MSEWDRLFLHSTARKIVHCKCFMKLVKILSVIVVACLTACKSTVPQAESLLEERVSSAGENSSSSVTVPKPKYASPKDSAAIYDNLADYVKENVFMIAVNDVNSCDCGGYSLSSCDLDYNEKTIQLNIVSRHKKIRFSFTIKNGKASVQEEFTGLDDEAINSLCTDSKMGSFEKKVECSSKHISVSFHDDFNNYNLRDLGLFLDDICQFMMEYIRARCNYDNCNKSIIPENLDDLE